MPPTFQGISGSARVIGPPLAIEAGLTLTYGFRFSTQPQPERIGLSRHGRQQTPGKRPILPSAIAFSSFFCALRIPLDFVTWEFLVVILSKIVPEIFLLKCGFSNKISPNRELMISSEKEICTSMKTTVPDIFS